MLNADIILLGRHRTMWVHQEWDQLTAIHIIDHILVEPG